MATRGHAAPRELTASTLERLLAQADAAAGRAAGAYEAVRLGLTRFCDGGGGHFRIDEPVWLAGQLGLWA